MPTLSGRSRPRIRIVAAALALTTAALVAGCDSQSNDGSSPGGTTPSTIVVGVGAAPLSLDPAKNGNTADNQLVMNLAYESLIKLAPDGSLTPGLAESWDYTDDSLTTFELKLRSDAKFSDGEPVTADAVVASLKHEQTANGPVAVYVKTIKTAEAVDPSTVRLTLVRPDPTIAFILTQRFLIGDIVGPTGAKDPDILGTQTNGAGPYMLDPKQTVSGDHYTFVPNPYYYDKDAVHFDKFTVRVMANPQAALDALKTGQVSYISGDSSQFAQLADSAKSAGLAVHSTLSAWYAIFLFDRDGAVVPALRDQRVRQALNYATDRAGIMNVLFGEYGEPNDEISVPGYEGQGYDPDYKDHYTYNPEKAKQLLTEAGYPDGFEMSIGGTAAFGNGATMAQAVAGDWAKVGVKVDIKSFNDIPALLGPWQDKTLPAVAGGYDTQPLYITAGQALAKDAGLFNPFESEDAQLTALIAQAYAATGEDQVTEAWNAVQRRVVDLGWFVPLGTGSTIFFSDTDLKGVELSPTSFAPNPVLFHF